MIRTATKADLPKLISLVLKGKRDSPIDWVKNLEALQKEVENGSGRVFVSYTPVSLELNGYARTANVNQHKSLIADIYAGDEAGNELLTHISTVHSVVEIAVTGDNKPLTALVSKAGYTNTGEGVWQFKSKPNSSAAVINNKSTLPTRYEELDGVKYLVAPVIMVQEQVLSYPQGNELLPAEEIEKSVNGWNGRPVVIYHPEGTANSPDTARRYEVGKIYNAHYEKKQLKAEIWVDESKAESKTGDSYLALQMIKNGEPLEVSTGYYVNSPESSAGEYGGVSYQAVQRDIMPDHLALLPQKTGNCSYADGCGVRANQKGGNVVMSIIKLFKGLVNNRDFARFENPRINELNNDEIWQKLSEQVKKTYQRRGNIQDVYVVTYYPEGKQVIFEAYLNQGEYRLYRTGYEIDESENITLTENIEEVNRKVSYEPAQVVTTNQETEELKVKEKMIAAIIANSAGVLTEADAPVLNKLTECALYGMLPKAEQATFKVNCSKGTPAGHTTVNGGDGKPDTNARTMEEYLDGIPDADTREFIQNGVEQAKARRNELLTALKANKECTFTENELGLMTTCHLEKLNAILSAEKTAPKTNYSARGIQTDNPAVNESKGYTPLTVNIFDVTEKTMKKEDK